MSLVPASHGWRPPFRTGCSPSLSEPATEADNQLDSMLPSSPILLKHPWRFQEILWIIWPWFRLGCLHYTLPLSQVSLSVNVWQPESHERTSLMNHLLPFYTYWSTLTGCFYHFYWRIDGEVWGGRAQFNSIHLFSKPHLLSKRYKINKALCIQTCVQYSIYSY